MHGKIPASLGRVEAAASQMDSRQSNIRQYKTRVRFCATGHVSSEDEDGPGTPCVELGGSDDPL